MRSITIKKATDKNDTKSNTHVPGQYLGYSLQTTRCLALLLDAAPGSKVSIEVFEDVGVEEVNGYRIAEQSKTGRLTNPVADHSIDLWKTLSNWVDSIRSNELDVNSTKFVIYVSTPRYGEIVRSFNNAFSPENAHVALAAAKLEMLGTEPQCAKREQLRPELRVFVDNFFSADMPILQQLVRSFMLEVGTGSSGDDLKAALAKTLVPEDLLDDALCYALGWIKMRTDAIIESRKPAILSTDIFRNLMYQFVRKQDNLSILKSVALEPSQEQIQVDLNFRKYIRQLKLIGFEDTDLIQAVIDYQKAAADRTAWGAGGWVDEQSFIEFERNLQRAWSNVRQLSRARDSHLPDVQKGQIIYAECMRHNVEINGLGVPDHFTPGSFHSLADIPILGWHPDYESQLNGTEDAGGS